MNCGDWSDLNPAETSEVERQIAECQTPLSGLREEPRRLRGVQAVERCFRRRVMKGGYWGDRIALSAGGTQAPAESSEVEWDIAECARCQMLLSGLHEELGLLREMQAVERYFRRRV